MVTDVMDWARSLGWTVKVVDAESSHAAIAEEEMRAGTLRECLVVLMLSTTDDFRLIWTYHEDTAPIDPEGLAAQVQERWPNHTLRFLSYSPNRLTYSMVIEDRLTRLLPILALDPTGAVRVVWGASVDVWLPRYAIFDGPEDLVDRVRVASCEWIDGALRYANHLGDWDSGLWALVG